MPSYVPRIEHDLSSDLYESHRSGSTKRKGDETPRTRVGDSEASLHPSWSPDHGGGSSEATYLLIAAWIKDQPYEKTQGFPLASEG